MSLVCNLVRNYRLLGFTLVELLIVIAIISVLLSLAIPQYTKYTGRAKFLEVISAAQPYKLAAELAVQVDGVDIDSLSAGEYGIPDEVVDAPEQYVQSIAMNAGVIYIISENIFPQEEEQPTYELVATIENGRILWTVADTSSCLSKNICTK